MRASRWGRAVVSLALLAAGCATERPPSRALTVSLATSPGGLDPRTTTDDASQKVSQFIFDDLLELDDRLQVVPHLAERFDQVSPTVYRATLRQGVRFHNGAELTAEDVVFTFRGYINPAAASPRKGGYRELASVDALGRYEVQFTLFRPYASFPINLVTPIVPAGSNESLGDHPVGTGPYWFVRYVPDDRLELAPFEGYFNGAPRNAGLILRVIPDDVMRGLEIERGSLDLIVNDLGPDIVHRMRSLPHLQSLEGPGVDYQYIGVNLRDSALADVRVRQALSLAIDRRALVDHLRRGLAVEASIMLPAQSWAAPEGLDPIPYEPERAKALLRAVGIALDVRLYEFATLYADVLAGNF